MLVLVDRFQFEVSLMRRLVTLHLSDDLKIENPNLKMLLQNLTELRELSLNGVHMSSTDLNFFANFSHLTNLFLNRCGLKGSFPDMIFQVPTLQKLDLSDNFFNGSIPPFYMSKNLQFVYLDGNLLTGQIPESFFTQERLCRLVLSDNLFSGTVKLERFLRLQKLTTLDLSYNNLSVDTSITNKSLSTFPQLSVLALASCNLYNFPDLTNQHRLELLDLSNNQITGEVPNWIWEIGNEAFYILELSANQLVGLQKPYHIPSSLFYLNLQSNVLQGELPPLAPNTGNSTSNLVYLSLANNSLSEAIPTSFCHAPLLQFLDLSANKLSGSIPPCLVEKVEQHAWLNLGGNNISGHITRNSTTNLVYLSLANNSLSEAIPTSFCNAPLLEVLDLSANILSGSIPPCLVEKVEQLVVLNLGGNNISGHISDTFSVNCSLEILDMIQNYLEGTLPASLANCKSLQVLNVGNNNIGDGFPCMLSSSLRVLGLRSNRFHGQVRCGRSWTNLQIIDIASNNFTGYLYAKSFLGMMLEKDARLNSDHIHYSGANYFGDYYRATVKVILKGVELKFEKILTIFKTIDFSCNNFLGEIPDSIGDLSSLRGLNLSHNNFIGTIPKLLGKLTDIESVDLSTNQLTGEIPKELTRLTSLAVLNLSNNQLIGPIPSGPQFQTFPANSFQGNAGLCGFPLNISCRHAGETDNVPPPNPYQKDEGINWDYVSVALGYVVGLGSILWLLFFCRSFRYKFNDWTKQVFEKIFSHKNRRKRHEGRVRRRRNC
ncbi:receptor-like protein 12 isoform X1 [Sesamum indicum]|uniref:Receptor-like protein 12 isoform X1 n=2 Tax=Sesamum indicum TaxID=4182 RepID=A0A8M8V0P1_SESIN|nr:receptor-like protein 12 isoform X1 [Sesamum indicum]